MAEAFANSKDPDQTPPSAVSDLGLHCLPNTLLGVSQLQWVDKHISYFSMKTCHYENTPLFKYIENFTTKKENFQIKKILIFYIFLLKT